MRPEEGLAPCTEGEPIKWACRDARDPLQTHDLAAAVAKHPTNRAAGAISWQGARKVAIG